MTTLVEKTISSSSSSSSSPQGRELTSQQMQRLQTLQDIIGTDAGQRGMQSLIVPGDLARACQAFVQAAHHAQSVATAVGQKNESTKSQSHSPKQSQLNGSLLVVLSGFPCCITQSPPTETDGPPGAVAIARAGVALGFPRVIIITDECNRIVFEAALQPEEPIGEQQQPPNDEDDYHTHHHTHSPIISLECFPATSETSYHPDYPDMIQRLQSIYDQSALIVACERAGPGKDGHCYTMRGLDMTKQGLIAPVHTVLEQYHNNKNNHGAGDGPTFIAIGDGGNELGMGKVLPAIQQNIQIPQADTIACVIPADHLIAASVSNWGAYALVVGAAYLKATQHKSNVVDGKATTEDQDEYPPNTPHVDDDVPVVEIEYWIKRCVPTEEHERKLLDRCVAVGCRDGVTGRMESTVDGMPLERSLQCLRELQQAVLGK